MDQEKLIHDALNEMMVAQFTQWRVAGVTHVALGCQGFEPVTVQQARCEGRRAYDVDADKAEIMRNMLERLTAALQDAEKAAIGAALGGRGGMA